MTLAWLWRKREGGEGNRYKFCNQAIWGSNPVGVEVLEWVSAHNYTVNILTLVWKLPKEEEFRLSKWIELGKRFHFSFWEEKCSFLAQLDPLWCYLCGTEALLHKSFMKCEMSAVSSNHSALYCDMQTMEMTVWTLYSCSSSWQPRGGLWGKAFIWPISQMGR